MLKANNPLSIEIIAYCLMPNHFHFIIRQLEPFGISDFMRGVCDGYAKAINKERSRSGHLFEGKYKMKHIDSDLYLFHLFRYIHLNPVRACLVSLPEEWQHSSCQAYYGLRPDPVITTQLVLGQLGGLRNYRKFVEDYVSQDKEVIKTVLFNER
jgi:REP element-mobilizing transposase RayT